MFSASAWRVQNRKLFILEMSGQEILFPRWVFQLFKESLEEFAALTWGTRMSEFFKRKQGRLGMGPAVL
jgi:hypothetical protein